MGPGAAVYNADPAVQRLTSFFTQKGLTRLKEEDRAEHWYDDWIAFQAEHELYAGILSPSALSTRGHRFNLLRMTRFWEAAAYFSPAHAYSLHVTFLGLFPILRSDNDALKQEAIRRLEAGGLFAFAVSEQEHGADLLGNEFTVTEIRPGWWSAGGSKYYIGNAQAACIVSVLAKEARGAHVAGSRRTPLLFFALRPGDPGAVRAIRKIRTLGVRGAYVAAFDVDAHKFPQSDVICQGRDAWESFFATVNLGKFFLGFGSIGICEHALAETVTHTQQRILYGKPVSEMPHIRAAMVHAYARLMAMKLFAYRALDYVNAATQEDRRYLLFTAVQKARVSSEGVKVMALLSECIGAKGFEADTYFETALRDVSLVPMLEGSTHINHLLVAQFTKAYFPRRRNGGVPTYPPYLSAAEDAVGENTYLLTSKSEDIRTIRFADCLYAYRPLTKTANVAAFVRQVRLFRLFARRCAPALDPRRDAEALIAVGKCVSVIAFAQLVAEHCTIARVSEPFISLLFHQSIEDLGQESARLASLPQFDAKSRRMLSQVMALPETSQADLDAVVVQVATPM